MTVLVVAHRGASGAAPENTLPAITEAIRQRADFVEVDLQLSADGEVVLFHDPNLTRTTDVAELFPDREPWRIGDFTLAELRTLDAGGWFGAPYAGERIPTLREALEAMAGRIGMWLELKSPRLHPGLEKAVAEVLRTTEGDWLTRPGTCVATCFEADALDRFAGEIGSAAGSTVPLGQLAKTFPDDETLRREAARVTYYIPDSRQAQPSDLIRARAAGLQPVCWTPNDPVTLATLVVNGAAAIITNYPGLARDVATGTYAPPRAGLVLEHLDDRGAVVRNLDPEPVPAEGWQLRGDPADPLWIGATEILPGRGTLEVSLEAKTDSVALHRPDGALADVVGRGGR